MFFNGLAHCNYTGARLCDGGRVNRRNLRARSNLHGRINWPRCSAHAQLAVNFGLSHGDGRLCQRFPHFYKVLRERHLLLERKVWLRKGIAQAGFFRHQKAHLASRNWGNGGQLHQQFNSALPCLGNQLKPLSNWAGATFAKRRRQRVRLCRCCCGGGRHLFGNNGICRVPKANCRKRDASLNEPATNQRQQRTGVSD